MMSAMLFMIMLENTKNYDLPKGLLQAVGYVESRLKTGAINKHDRGGAALGVWQVKHSTAKLLGYKGTAKILQNDDRVNCEYASKYLSWQLRRYNGDFIKAIAAYNAGTYIPRKDGSPKNIKYVKKVLEAWAEGRQ